MIHCTIKTKSKLPKVQLKHPKPVFFKTNAKTNAPKTKVFSGVKEFSIDVTELSISVCAIGKKSRNKSPKHRSHRNKLPFFFGIFDKLQPISNKKTAAR
jgi:hypothetical protein